MKNVIVFILVLQTGFTLAQEHFSVDVYFDPNSISMSNANGNQQSAINTLVNVSVPIKETESGHFFLGQSFQYASLANEQYYRYAILQVGYSLRSFLLKNMIASAAVNYGLTKTHSQGFTNYGTTFDLSYNFNDRLKVSSLLQVVRRNDKEVHMGINRTHIYKSCLFIGIKFDLFRVHYI
jgi:hypothetical protein